ncbi:MAG: bifunctional 4'-phosphopantothenoylcysteine decarboxylase/phosphopantothenoylcysteine synthetase, partial [Chloroflexi bacterium]|nr:bifunctional 4'-phosphopantothenoylcysteine decarboxylase/phosphopantothenoylcysteine synthetase [Chloroflexota bacterium]
MILAGKHIVLGVTGGIAVYKAVDLCSKLVQAGAAVDVIMTEAATRFVTPLPFQTITQRPVSTDMFQLLRDADMAHISLSQKADALLIAPCTANTMAKLAHGLADNLLTSTALATTAPWVIAPAMDADMWANPVTQQNAALLRDRGAVIVGPGYGRLASSRIGAGRLVSTEEILAALR